MRKTEDCHSFLRKIKGLLLFATFATVFLFSIALTTVPVLAQDMPGMGGERSAVPTKNMSPLVRFIEVNNDALFTPMDVTLDIVGVILMLIAIFALSKSVREYGKSTIGIAILYFLNATLVLGAIRLIFILDDDNILNVKDIAEMTAWHTLFYYAIILFYLAGFTLTKLVSAEKGKGSYKIAIFFFIITTVLSVGIVGAYGTPVVGNFLVKYLQDTWFSTFGWFHIIALILSGGIAIYLYTVKNKYKGFSSVIGYLYISLALLATIHLWELLNESWRVIVVSSDFGEFFERCLWIPVFIFVLYSFIKLRSITTVESTTPQVTEPGNLATPTSQFAQVVPSPSQAPAVESQVTPTTSAQPSGIPSQTNQQESPTLQPQQPELPINNSGTGGQNTGS
jgi:hypothetical protein